MTSAIGSPNSAGAAQGAASNPSASPQTNGTDNLANEQTFLQLLVAQLKNQDPLSPADGLQFVEQLAQFSSLEQQLQMRQDLDTITGVVSPPASSDASTQSSSQNSQSDGTQNTQN